MRDTERSIPPHKARAEEYNEAVGGYVPISETDARLGAITAPHPAQLETQLLSSPAAALLERYRTDEPERYRDLLCRLAYLAGAARLGLKEPPKGGRRGRPHLRSETELAQFVCQALKQHGFPSSLRPPMDGAAKSFVEEVLTVCFTIARRDVPYYFEHYDPKLNKQNRKNGSVPTYRSRSVRMDFIYTSYVTFIATCMVSLRLGIHRGAYWRRCVNGQSKNDTAAGGLAPGGRKPRYSIPMDSGRHFPTADQTRRTIHGLACLRDRRMATGPYRPLLLSHA